MFNTSNTYIKSDNNKKLILSSDIIKEKYEYSFWIIIYFIHFYTVHLRLKYLLRATASIFF